MEITTINLVYLLYKSCITITIMSSLTPEKTQKEKNWLQFVEKQASKKSIKKIAVENFLMSVGQNQTEYNAKQNLYADAQSYKWNSATINTIYKGIEKYFKEFV